MKYVYYTSVNANFFRQRCVIGVLVNIYCRKNEAVEHSLLKHVVACAFLVWSPLPFLDSHFNWLGKTKKECIAHIFLNWIVVPLKRVTAT